VPEGCLVYGKVYEKKEGNLLLMLPITFLMALQPFVEPGQLIQFFNPLHSLSGLESREYCRKYPSR
jgi:hypothetical protein